MDNLQDGFNEDDIKQQFTELYQILGEKLKYKVNELCEIYKELHKNCYKIYGFIGSGTEGPVFAALYNGNQIAVKVLSADDASKIDNQLKIMERFKKQPNIHQFLNAFYSEDGKYFFYITEKLTCDLEHMMLAMIENNSTFSYSQIIAFAIQMATALSIFEKNKVIHSDLKPANILYDKFNKCFKISDYGFSKIIQQKSKQIRSATQSVNGCTAKYAAPEILQQNQDYSSKVDIYSLGLILLELVHGRELHLFQVMKILGGGAQNIQGYLKEGNQYTQFNKIIQSMLVVDRNSSISASELLMELNSLQSKEESKLNKYLQTRVDDITLKNFNKLYSTAFSQIKIDFIKDNTKSLELKDVNLLNNQVSLFQKSTTTTTRFKHHQIAFSQSQSSTKLNNFFNKTQQFPKYQIPFVDNQQFQHSIQSNKKIINSLSSQVNDQQFDLQNKLTLQKQQQLILKNKQIIQPISKEHKKLKFKNWNITSQQRNEIEETFAKYHKDNNTNLDVVLQFNGFNYISQFKEQFVASKLATVLEQCSLIITSLDLKLNNLGLDEWEMKSIFQSIGMMHSNLTILNLDISDKIGSEGSQNLAGVIDKCSNNLKVVGLFLRLNSMEIGSGGMRQITQSLEKCYKMTTLMLYLNGSKNHNKDNDEDDTINNKVIEPNVGLLCVSFLASSLQQCKSLTELTLSIIYSAINNVGLQSLSLSIEKCEKLERLNLQILEFGIDEQSIFEEFGTSLAKCHNLRYLNIQLDEIKDEMMPKFIHGISKFQLCDKLSTLTLFFGVADQNKIKNFQSNLIQCENLTSLSLILRSWSLDNIITLITELENSSIITLKIVYDQGTEDESLQQSQLQQYAINFGESLSKFQKLKSIHLFLAQTNVNPTQFVVTLLSCLSEDITVLSLGIKCNKGRISTSDAKILGESLEKCQYLKELNLYLWQSEIKQIGALSLSNSLQKCTNLSSLKLSIKERCCNDQNHKHIYDIDSVSPIITKNLKNCKNLSDLQVKVKNYKYRYYYLQQILFKLGILTRSESKFWY